MSLPPASSDLMMRSGDGDAIVPLFEARQMSLIIYKLLNLVASWGDHHAISGKKL
jgi:hypothetical protein